MGQFSWLDCRTEEQILDNVRADVYVLIPKEFGGGHIHETCYDGYGSFGGHDIYDLVVDWNINYMQDCINRKHEFVSGWLNEFETVQDVRDFIARTNNKRHIGIAIACYDEDNKKLKYPIKITHNPYAVYEDCDMSLSDPNQGWLIDDDDDDYE